MWHNIWLWLGQPSKISEFLSLYSALSTIFNIWFYSKIKKIDDIKNKLDLIGQEVKDQKELFTTRINDIKK